MSDQPNISQILAALAQRPGGTPSQTHQQGIGQPHQAPHLHHGPPQNSPQPYQAPYPQQYAAPPSLPVPINSGSIDLSAVKPIHSGSVNLADDRSRAGYPDRGPPYNDAQRGVDYRNSGSSYRPSRSRSRSPSRYGRETFRDNFNPYRDDRRADSRTQGSAQRRDRSLSPNMRSRVGGYGAVDYSEKLGTTQRVDDNSEIMSINSNLVGLIIGRSGENLRRVETETKTRVQFVTPPDTGVPERDCRITGPPMAREHAKAEIYRIIQESGKAGGPPPGRAPPPPDRDLGLGMKSINSNQPALRAGEDSTQMMVPNRTVGLIIGKGGETIRDLQERSRCHVNILGEEKSVGGFRPVNLIGSLEAARKAKDLILQIVESDSPAGSNVAAMMRENEFGGSGESDRLNDRVFVPSEAVGMIIGKGGETIKDMQNASGCKINVSPASGRDVEREIGLVGTRDSIERAKATIMEKVRSVQDKNRAGGGMQRGQMSADYSTATPQQSYGSQTNQSQGGDPDPYAAYGGYQNYVALWYSSLQANAGQPDSHPQGSPGS